MALNGSRQDCWIAVVHEVHRQWRSIGEAIDLGPGKLVTISLWNESETQPHAAWFEELILVSTTM